MPPIPSAVRALLLPLLLGFALLCMAAPPPATVVPLPETEIRLHLGMSMDELTGAIAPRELLHCGDDHGRALYSVEIVAPKSRYTLDLTTAGDSLTALSVTAIDSGAVEKWFRKLTEELPMTATYEKHLGELEQYIEVWTTFEAVWTTEYPANFLPGADPTYWEVRRR